MYTPMFDRDLLYPTKSQMEPGSVHVAVMKPDNQGKLPVFISSKSNHNPMDYLPTLIGILQADIFDRTRIDIKERGLFFFVLPNNEYIKLFYQDGQQVTEKVSNVEF
ncbi:MAG: hypothetical protein KBA53_08745 [Thermoclostridium sp.]|nr:hypothetical protein [Thermoclostridium sp.]